MFLVLHVLVSQFPVVPSANPHNVSLTNTKPRPVTVTVVSLVAGVPVQGLRVVPVAIPVKSIFTAPDSYLATSTVVFVSPCVLAPLFPVVLPSITQNVRLTKSTT